MGWDGMAWDRMGGWHGMKLYDMEWEDGMRLDGMGGWDGMG